nr:MAG TPA: Thioredoxin [Caudoviricetes sp.]
MVLFCSMCLELSVVNPHSWNPLVLIFSRLLKTPEN